MACLQDQKLRKAKTYSLNTKHNTELVNIIIFCDISSYLLFDPLNASGNG